MTTPLERPNSSGSEFHSQKDPLQILRGLAAFQRLSARFYHNPDTQEGLLPVSLTFGDIADIEELFWLGRRDDLGVIDEPRLNPDLRGAAQRAMEIMLPTISSGVQHEAVEKFLAKARSGNFDREDPALEYPADLRILFEYELGGPEFEIVHSGSSITVVKMRGSEGRYHVWMPDLDGSDNRYPHRMEAFVETGILFVARAFPGK